MTYAYRSQSRPCSTKYVSNAASPTRERPARAERAQAHVDAIREAVLGALIEQLDEKLAEAQVVALRLDLDAALDGPVGVEEHQIDVRREVQLDAAELAHAEHEQRQLAAIRVARPSEPRLQARGGKTERGLDEALGEQRDVGERRVEIGDTREIVPSNARHLDVARAPQRRHRLRLIAGSEIEARHDRLRVERPVVGEARAQNLRVAQQHTEHEVADEDDSSQRLGCRLRQLDVEIDEARGHARKALFERRWKVDGALHYHGEIEDAGTSGMIPLASSRAENRAYCRAMRNADTIVG